MHVLEIEYSPRKHIPALDSVRGLAVLSVMLYHCFSFALFKFGWIGVDLFFVLSGFLITGILLESRDTRNYYKNFIVRRALRIFPLYYFILLICLVILPVIWPMLFGNGFEYYIHYQPWFWLYMQNWLYSKTGFPENLTLVHLWSLAVEEQFYIFWPLVVRIFNVKKMFVVCIIFIAFSLVFRFYIGSELGLVYPYTYMATLSRMDALIIGAIIAILIRIKPAWLEKYTFYVFVLSSLALGGGLLILKSAAFSRLASVYTLIDILAGCLLIFMLNKRRFVLLRPFYHPLFSFLGKYSYGLYIYHYIIYGIFEANVFPRLMDIVEKKQIALVIVGIMVLIISIPVSVLSYRYVEKPFLKLKRFFPDAEK